MLKILLFLRLAGGNLRRFKRRTLLVGATVTLAATVQVFTGSLGNGIEKQLLDNLVFFQTGHLLLSPQASGEPAPRWLSPPAGLEVLAGRNAAIRAVHPRLETAVMLQARGGTVTRAYLVGLDPERESPDLAPLLPIRSGGSLPTLKPGSLLLSAEYAGRLHVALGDPVTVTASTPHGGIRVMDFRLAGVFQKGAPWQEFFLFAPLVSVQRLLDVPGRVSSLRLLLQDPADAERIRGDLKAFLQQTGNPWSVKTYQEAGGFSLGIVQANRFSLLLMDSLLLSVTILGISLMILLSLQIRFPEFRTMSLLGTSPGWLRTLIILEALLLGLFFGTGGILLGTGLSHLLHERGLSVSSLPLTYLLGGNRLVPLIQWPSVFKAWLVIMACCLTAALIPLWQNRRGGFIAGRGRPS